MGGGEGMNAAGGEIGKPPARGGGARQKDGAFFMSGRYAEWPETSSG
jgi:hypothetical protein